MSGGHAAAITTECHHLPSGARFFYGRKDTRRYRYDHDNKTHRPLQTLSVAAVGRINDGRLPPHGMVLGGLGRSDSPAAGLAGSFGQGRFASGMALRSHPRRWSSLLVVPYDEHLWPSPRLFDRRRSSPFQYLHRPLYRAIQHADHLSRPHTHARSGNRPPALGRPGVPAQLRPDRLYLGISGPLPVRVADPDSERRSLGGLRPFGRHRAV